MKLSRLFTVVSLVLVATRAGAYEFTDIDGRTIRAEIAGADKTSVEVKLANGRNAKIDLERLCPADRVYVIGWRKEREKAIKQQAADQAAKKRAADIPVQITEFCSQNLGKQVGNGECWTLANEAFKACGLHRPGPDLRVWGRLLDYTKEDLQPGDIVEYRSAKFSNGSWTGPEHTSVVVKADRKGVVIAQQNWAGKKTVSQMGFDPKTLTAGQIMIYRPQ